MSHYRNGKAREYRVRDAMIAADWHCIAQTAGSKGPADLVMAHDEHGLALVQVGSKSKRLGPADRARLLRAAQICAALPILAVVVPRQAIRYWHVNEAPPARWETWSP